MNHLFVGAAIPFLVAAVVYAWRGFRAGVVLLFGAPLAMFLGATWAVLPDLPRTFGFLPYDADALQDPALDLFFWHYTINHHESASPWFSVGFVLMVAAILAAAWRELYIRESGRP